MNFEEKLNNFDQLIKVPIKTIDKHDDVNDFEFENKQQTDRAKTDQELEKARQEIISSHNLEIEEVDHSKIENQTAFPKTEKETNLLDRIKIING